MKVAKPTLTASLLIVLPCAWCLAADPAPAPAPSRRESYTDRYAVLWEHNIFLRDRSRYSTNRGAPTTVPARPPEEAFVLRGVVLDEDGVCRAYVEDLNTAEILRRAVGESLARGKVARIDLDALDYERAGQHTWIEVGSDLTGAAAPLIVASSDSPSTAPSSAPSAPLPNATDPNLTLEQRLRLRRLQELKGK
jgi:hypothetical protein